jgi:hypothetical protein
MSTLPDAEELKRKVKPAIEHAMLAEHRKAQLEMALDSSLDVIAQIRDELRTHGEDFNSGDRQKLAVTLEQMGRLCWSVARECERQKGAR